MIVKGHLKPPKYVELAHRASQIVIPGPLAKNHATGRKICNSLSAIKLLKSPPLASLQNSWYACIVAAEIRGDVELFTDFI